MWFRRKQKPEGTDQKSNKVPEGLWLKCENCREIMFAKTVEENHKVCPKCGYHFRIKAMERLDTLFDQGDYQILFEKVRSTDPLEFKGPKATYKEKLEKGQKAGSQDAVVVAEGSINENPAVIAAMDYSFMGGSMGSVVGEKITLAAEHALKEKKGLVVVSASGGARMQEGAVSLMQMAKISAALARLSKARLPYISILTDPTTGGVTASYAMLGDVNIAEPKALICFAGPRVIRETIRQTLPEGFQRSEFLLEHGMLDMVVPRTDLKQVIGNLLGLMLPAKSDSTPAG